MRVVLLLLLALAARPGPGSAEQGGLPAKKLRMAYATGPLLKFQIWHIASFLSVFKLVLIGLIIVGKDPFAFFGMQAPSIWQWGQENKVYACMMVFFLSNMIENQCMSTGAFEITLNGIKWQFPKAARLRPMKACTEDSALLVQTGCFSRSCVVPPEKNLMKELFQCWRVSRSCTVMECNNTV
ncbi:thioredoxin reductase-like selenoprotein T isoform 3-T3 [Amazona ochrocephala]